MRFTVAAAAALVAGASASYLPYNVTVPSYTEIPCEGPTEVPYTYGGTTSTITVTEATTLTLPCDTTSAPPVYSTPVAPPVYSTPAAPPVYSTPVYTPAPPMSTGSPIYPTANGTTYAPPAGTGYPTTSAPPPAFTGAASKAGVGLAAVLGFAAYVL